MQAAARAEKPVAVVTGANTGIGFHVAGQLAAKGYDVVLACRNMSRGETALQALRQLHGEGVSARSEALDLGSFASTKTLAERLAARHPRIDLLVCNAGLNAASVSWAPEEQLTADGVDVVYQTNFLSHLLLTLLLLPQLRAARGRVVSVTSVVHRMATREQLELARAVREPYKSLYGLSKLAQIVASSELHRRYGDEVAFHCVNPGGVASDIYRGFPVWQQRLFSAIMVRPETAAESVVQACVREGGGPPASPGYFNGYLGANRTRLFEYWSPCPARAATVASAPSELASDIAFREKLWSDAMAALGAAGFGHAAAAATARL